MPHPTFDLIVIKTNQMEIMREFYSRIGFQFTQEQHAHGPVHYSAPLGDGIIEIYPLRHGLEPDSSLRLGFGVSNLIDSGFSGQQC